MFYFIKITYLKHNALKCRDRNTYYELSEYLNFFHYPYLYIRNIPSESISISIKMATASENDCLNDPNFAVICNFLDRYGELMGLNDISYTDLQTWLEDTKHGS